jgi:hypothetical protein
MQTCDIFCRAAAMSTVQWLTIFTLWGILVALTTTIYLDRKIYFPVTVDNREDISS